MPLYLGNTKIDKFTAKIEGGAASLEGNLTVITPPTKLVYDVGDSFDPRGMKVIATIGGLEVPVGSYTVSPDHWLQELQKWCSHMNLMERLRREVRVLL